MIGSRRLAEGWPVDERFAFINVAAPERKYVVLKYGHCSALALEPELCGEGLLARHRVQDDLLGFGRKAHQCGYELFPAAGALMTGKNDNMQRARFDVRSAHDQTGPRRLARLCVGRHWLPHVATAT